MFKKSELEIKREVIKGQVYLLGELSKILSETIKLSQKMMRSKMPSYDEQIASLESQKRQAHP